MATATLNPPIKEKDKTSSEKTAVMAPTYIPALDSLRGIAVTLVIIFHFSKATFNTLNFEIGWIGVQMFFVLSGYLITRILLNDKEQRSFGGYAKRFYWRRLVRIFPLYYTYLGLLLTGYLAFNIPEDFKILAPYLFTYTYNFSVLTDSFAVSRFFMHLWSLSVEEQFYIFWPLIVYFFPQRSLRIVTVAMILLTPLLRLALGLIFQQSYSTELSGLAVYWFTFSHLDAFAIGAALVLFHTSLKKHYALKYFIGALVACLIAGALNLWMSPYVIDRGMLSSLGYPIESLANYQHVWSYTILNIFFAATIFLLINSKNIMNRGPLLAIGKVSYGMYLFHFPIIMVLERIFLRFPTNNYIALGVCFIVTFGISWVSFYFYEKRFLTLKSRVQ